MESCSICGGGLLCTHEGWLVCPECDTVEYIMCDHCNGYGSSLKEQAERCTKCGGSGVVKPTTSPKS